MILDSLQVEEGAWAEAKIDLKEGDWFFKCHFPGNPIFPEFLLLESMGQVLLSTFIRQADLKGSQVPLMTEIKDIYLGGLCVPGDKVMMRAELKRFKYGIARGEVVAYKENATEHGVLAEVKIGFATPSALSRL